MTARQEKAAREMEEAKKLSVSAQANAKQSGEEAAELRGQIEFLKKQTEAEKLATDANNPKSA